MQIINQFEKTTFSTFSRSSTDTCVCFCFRFSLCFALRRAFYYCYFYFQLSIFFTFIHHLFLFFERTKEYRRYNRYIAIFIFGDCKLSVNFTANICKLISYLSIVTMIFKQKKGNKGTFLLMQRGCSDQTISDV